MMKHMVIITMTVSSPTKHREDAGLRRYLTPTQHEVSALRFAQAGIIAI
jgi:hypothetical protein